VCIIAIENHLQQWKGKCGSLDLCCGVLLANVAQATAEERWDVGARFQAEYEKYRKRTRMLGPVWFWLTLIGILLALAGVPYLLRP